MNRPLLLIASRHEAVAAALRQYVGLLFPNSEMSHRVEHFGFSSSAELFEKLDDYPPGQLREAMVLFDLSSEDGGSWEVRNMWSERGIAAQLLMSYPEVFFVFLHQNNSAGNFPFKPGPGGADRPRREIMCAHHFVRADRLHEVFELIRHHARGFRTIFDATGLRSYVKQRLLKEVGGDPQNDDASQNGDAGKDDHAAADPRPRNAANIYEPLSASRQRNAAAVTDEESAFVYLNGYVAYQAGFSAWLMGTEAEFKRLLWRPAPVGGEEGDGGVALKPRVRVGGPGTFQVVLSDWDLAFPDIQGDGSGNSLLLTEGLLKPEERLILITSFHDQSQVALLSDHRGFREVKPYGGIFRLLTYDPPEAENPLKAAYETAWAEVIREEPKKGWPRRAAAWVLGVLKAAAGSLKARTRLAPGAGAAAPNPGAAPDAAAPPAGARHSAPHSRSVVANRLLSRARRIGAGGELCTEDAVQMALLAGEAKEILGGMSRTTAYDAISLQNEAEVGAEVSFLGMSAKVEVAQRLTKLEQEGRVVQHTQCSATIAGGQSGSRDSLRESREAHLHFLLQAVKRLRLRFTEHEQMDAAEECLRTFSESHYGLISLRSKPFSKGFEWYMLRATKGGTSVLRLLLFSLGWVLLLGLVYSVLLLSHPGFMAHDGRGSAATAANASDAERGGATADGTSLLSQPFEQWLAGRDRPWNCVWIGLWHSLLTFLELQPGLSDIEQLKMEQPGGSTFPSREWILIYRLTLLLELIVAYFHLGLLVSVLYRRITRRSP